MIFKLFGNFLILMTCNLINIPDFKSTETQCKLYDLYKVVILMQPGSASDLPETNVKVDTSMTFEGFSGEIVNIFDIKTQIVSIHIKLLTINQ